MTDAVKSLFSDYIPDPKDVKFSGEDDDEKIIMLLRRHVITNLRWVFSAFILGAIPVLLKLMLTLGNLDISAYLSPLHILVLLVFWYLVVATFCFESYLTWFSNVYIVTNKRLVDVDFHGLLSVQVTEAPLSNIQDVTFDVKGIGQTIFNFGTVRVQTASEVPTIEFEFVPKPAIVHDRISDMATSLRQVGRSA